MKSLPVRFASAQDAARDAAEAAQIIRRNEAETLIQRERLAHAKREIDRHLSLERGESADEQPPEQVAAE